MKKKKKRQRKKRKRKKKKKREKTKEKKKKSEASAYGAQYVCCIPFWMLVHGKSQNRSRHYPIFISVEQEASRMDGEPRNGWSRSRRS